MYMGEVGLYYKTKITKVVYGCDNFSFFLY